MAGEGVMGYGQFYEVVEHDTGDVHLRLGDNHARGSIWIKRCDGMNYDLRREIVHALGGRWGFLDRTKGDKPDQPVDELVSALYDLLADGKLDGDLKAIVGKVAEREQVRREAVLAQVQEVFGPNADIQIPR